MKNKYATNKCYQSRDKLLCKTYLDKFICVLTNLFGVCWGFLFLFVCLFFVFF